MRRGTSPKKRRTRRVPNQKGHKDTPIKLTKPSIQGMNIILNNESFIIMNERVMNLPNLIKSESIEEE